MTFVRSDPGPAHQRYWRADCKVDRFSLPRTCGPLSVVASPRHPARPSPRATRVTRPEKSLFNRLALLCHIVRLAAQRCQPGL